MDKYSGQSGTFIVVDGERVRAKPDSDGMITIGEQKLHRPETNEKGERVDRGADQQAAAAPQPAMPEPAKVAPWATPAEDKKGE